MKGLVLGFATALAALAATDAPPVTFYKDVLPVLQKNCQVCHRPGEAAPMSLLTYEQARPWAKALREAVLLKRMPPWFADPHYGKFSNDRSLSQNEINTLVAWADTGAREGNAKDAPPPRHFLDGWNIGPPDAVFEMPSGFQVPASGTIEYQYIVIPTGFTEDKWVQMAEVRPGNRAVVHHVIAFLRKPGSKWLKDAQPGIPFVPKKRYEAQNANQNRSGGAREDDTGSGNEFLVGFAPGVPPEMLKPDQAKLVPAGSDVVFQMHYTANGKPATDRTHVGFIFAKEPPRERVFTAATLNRKFIIPAGDANYEVHSEITIHDTTTLTGLLPHMHLRGKDFEYRIVYPTGESEILLSVPKYSFNWQLSYYLQKPLVLAKGTRIECTAHFDNSPNNPNNPNPREEVRWGDQSWEEMMIGFFDVAFDRNADPEKIFKEEKKKPATPARTGDE